MTGTVRRIAAYGSYGRVVSEGFSLQLGAGFDDKVSNDAPDLDFRMLSLDPMVRIDISGGSVGLGPGLQKIDIAGRSFRERYSAHIDWTSVANGAGYQSYVVEYGVNQHSAEFRDLDGASITALMRQQFISPFSGIDEISFEGGGGRESNFRGNPGLSNVYVYTRLATVWQMFACKWSASWMHQQSKYDAAMMEGGAARREAFDYLDLAVAFSLTESSELRIEFSRSRNRSNSAMFENRFRGSSISMVMNF